MHDRHSRFEDGEHRGVIRNRRHRNRNKSQKNRVSVGGADDDDESERGPQPNRGLGTPWLPWGIPCTAPDPAKTREPLRVLDAGSSFQEVDGDYWGLDGVSDGVCF